MSLCILYLFHRFLVRDFVYDEKELEAGKNEISKLETTRKKQFVSLQKFDFQVKITSYTIAYTKIYFSTSIP